jgi:hypothetical protein
VSAAEFRAGCWRAVLARADAVVTRRDIPATVRTRIDDAADAFYAANAAAIEGARGVPGIDSVPVAHQAGIEFGTVLMRQRASATVDDWGSDLAGRMTAAARDQPRLRISRDGSGAVTAAEVAGG